jgi:hypothetical protein
MIASGYFSRELYSSACPDSQVTRWWQCDSAIWPMIDSFLHHNKALPAGLTDE